MEDFNRETQIGLALGGGAVLGAAHVGVLRALQEKDIRIGAIAGTSIGALLAAMYAFGIPIDEIEEITLDLDWLDVTQISLSRYGLLSNEKMGELIDEVIGQVTFQDAGIPLAVVTADIRTGDKVIIDSGDVATAIMASTSLPGVYTPVEYQDRLLVDGGIVENVPISPLQSLGVEPIVGVDLLSKKALDPPDNIIGVMINAYNIAIRNAIRIQMEDADIVLAPDLSDFNMTGTDQVPELIRRGYDAVQVLGQSG